MTAFSGRSSSLRPQSNTPSPANVTKAKVDALTREIAQMRSRLEKLEAERELLVATLDLTSDVPPEVLSTILDYAMPEARSGFEKRREALLQVSTVCKAWLNASYPLWAYLKISLRKKVPSYEQLEGWFSHAGGAPRRLDIHSDTMFECRCCEGDTTCRMVNDTVIRALSDLPKLDHVVLSCEGSQCLTQIIQAVEAVADKWTRKSGKTVSWSSIKSLGVQIAWRGWIDNGDRTTSALSCIPPSITSLSLDIQRVNSASRYPEIHVPANILENLTFLSLSYNKLDSPTALNTLVKAPNLTRLRLECWDSLQTWDAHKRDVVLLYSVESLELILGRTGTALSALPLLRFPNLKTLHLLMQERGSKDELEDIMDALKFLSPEVPNPARGLRSLTIVDQYPLFISGVNTLSRVLRNLPSLDHLSLKNITFDANSLVEHDGKKILPNLQRLELEHSGRHEFPFDALFDYVKKGGSTLEVLTR